MQNHSPMLVLGGRAPQMRWGQGSLQEIDHVPFVRPVTKLAATADSTADIPGLVDEALATALRPHSGPTFVDLPLDFVFMEAEEPDDGPALPDPPTSRSPTGASSARSALLRDAERPVIMAGTDLYWGKRRGRAAASSPSGRGSRCSSTAWRAAACRPTTSCSSRARAATA